MSNSSIIRVPNHEWPFSKNERVRLELVYSLKTLKSGREPTTRAAFRSLTDSEKHVYLLEMDWLSIPRLAPGRIFSASPHITEGEPSGQDLWVDIPPTGVEILTLKDAQTRLRSTSLHEAFNEDALLPQTKVFHWFDSNGSEYWLPVIELIRKVFIRSPEMARAIIMYDGWHELVKEFSLHDEILEMTLTNHPQRGDVFYLALIASKPNLLNAWSSVANHLSRAGSGVSIGVPWPFSERVSIHATAKKKDSQFWIQELLDVYDMDIPYKKVIPNHPSYVNRIYEGERTQATGESERMPEGSMESEDVAINTITGSGFSKKHSAKVYVHIQTNTLSGFDGIKIEPEYNDKHEKSTVSDPNIEGNSRHNKTGLVEEVDGYLMDSISEESNQGIKGAAGARTKETESHEPLGGNLKDFVKAINHAKEELGDKAKLSWVVRERLLELPKSCGSRWFLKINYEVGRSWCMACIMHEGSRYYFLEVGRGESETKFSLSTLLVAKAGKLVSPEEWIDKMIENNGHWDTNYFKGKGIISERLHHRYKASDSWGGYFARQVWSINI